MLQMMHHSIYVQNTDHVSQYSHNKSVWQYQVLQLLGGFSVHLLENVGIDYALGSLLASYCLSEKIMIGAKPHSTNIMQAISWIISKFQSLKRSNSLSTEDQTVMISFSNVWNLLKFSLLVTTCITM